ncbi:polyprenyl diphosphate synthase [Streptomyces sp. NPDC060000]|uniref:polyprenyl diphosphate synthase n=1 Tax=Streptomyces sp. NPDC060000 TaxID=3347031 RepID=UPI0036B53B1C
MTADERLALLPPVVLDTLPRHIAFIADGNRRWATRQGLSVETGYEAGTAAVHRALAQCRALGVQVASVFIISERNFDRAEEHLQPLVKVTCQLVRQAAADADGPVRIIGRLDRAPHALVDTIRVAEAQTRRLPGMTVNLGIGYDGRGDIEQAARAAAHLNAGDDTAALGIGQHLATAQQPDPDLVVRTSGERRLSGFLLWQSADATLHFDDRLWPEWNDAALLEALAVHAAQTRTFGR